LKRVRGAVNFDRFGVRINSLKAQWLDQKVTIRGRTRGQGNKGITNLNMQGALRASDVLVHYKNPLDQFVRGTSNWNVDLSVPHSVKKLRNTGVSLTVTSDLVGTALVAPAPLAKSTASSKSFVLKTNFPTGENRQQWAIDYADSVNALVKVEQGNFQSLSAGFGGADANVDLAEGIRLDGSMPQASLGDWIDTINQYRNSLPSGPEQQKTLPISANLTASSLLLSSTIISYEVTFDTLGLLMKIILPPKRESTSWTSECLRRSSLLTMQYLRRAVLVLIRENCHPLRCALVTPNGMP